MSTVKLRNVNPLGYVDLPVIGRQGPAPYLVCHDPENCHDEHEHTQVVDEQHGEPGSGCLVPGEVFEVSDEIAHGHEPADSCKVCGTDKGTACLGTSGLLDQVGNYELVKAPAKKAAKKAPAKKAEMPAETEDPNSTDPKDV